MVVVIDLLPNVKMRFLFGLNEWWHAFMLFKGHVIEKESKLIGQLYNCTILQLPNYQKKTTIIIFIKWYNDMNIILHIQNNETEYIMMVTQYY